jgi:hypothetical protein
VAENTEDVKVPATPEVENKTPAVEEKSISKVEQRAMDQGWVPKEEWTGDPDDWRPAREFIDRGELFKKIDDQSRTLKDYKRALEQLSQHNTKLAAVEYQRAIQDLKRQKKEALDTGDSDAVIEIDDRIDAVKHAQTQIPQVKIPDVAESNPIFQNWQERNSWYNSNRVMRVFADRIGLEAAKAGKTPVEVLSIVEQEVKKEFASKFSNPNRDKPGAVETSRGRGTASKETFTLSDDERRVMQRFVRTVPGMTEAKYIADLKKIKGV